MAFNGNLHEFGIVALIQLPNTNRLTGLLSIAGERDSAEFYYKNGKLLHAVFGELEGKEVLAAIIDWTEGEFTFESDVTVEKVSIEEDLHHLLMWSLKERDERVLREEEQKAAEAERKRLETVEAAEAERQRLISESANAPSEDLPDPYQLPDDILIDLAHANYAFVADSAGIVVAETVAEEEFRLSMIHHRKAIASFIRDYPDGGVGKTFIEDSEFSIALSGIENGDTLVLFAVPNTRLGTLSMELSKFIRKLENSGLGEYYDRSGTV